MKKIMWSGKKGNDNKEMRPNEARNFMKIIKLPKSFSTLRLKLLLAFMVPIAFIVILGVISLKTASQGIRSNYEETVGQVVDMTSEYLSFGIESIENISVEYFNSKDISSYALAMSSEDKLEAKKIQSNLQTEITTKSKTDKFISNIYFLFDEVSSITSNQSIAKKIGTNIYEGFVETEVGKYIKANKMKLKWVGTDTYLDEKLGISNSDYAFRLIRSLQTRSALLVIDVKASVVQEILQNISIDKSGYLSFVTGDGKEVSADGVSEAIFSNQEFYKKAIESDKDSDSNYVTYKGKEYLFLYSKIGETGAMLCAMIPKAVISSQEDQIKGVTFVVVVIACIIAVLISLLFSLGIDKTIKDIISNLKKAAKGDLTVQFHIRRNDEFKTLIQEIQATFTNMKELIRQVHDLSGKVSESASGLSNTSKSFLKSSEDISVAMNGIEQGIFQQAKDAEECLHQMDNLSEKIALVSNSTKEISEIADATKKSVLDGTDCTEDLNKQTKSTIDITTDIINAIEKLSTKSQAISKISNVISDIANQTNLLSLNASIEAARAGMYGKGFAVVADEIRHLAEQSNQSVNDIKKIITSIQEDTKSAVEIARKAESVLGLQENVVKNTTASYQNINQSVESLIQRLREITENVNNMEESRVSTLAAIESISAVLEEIAASSNTVNQTAGDQMTSVEALNVAANNLNENANELLQAVQEFSI